MAIFDGVTLRVTLDAPVNGIREVDVQEDLYEPWKTWLRDDTSRLGFPQLFRTSAGDPLTPGLDIGGYFFLQNQHGWRIISTDEDQEARYVGNLIPEDVLLPIIVPTPGRTVTHIGLQPITQRIDQVLADVVLIKAVTAGRVDISADGLTIEIYSESGVLLRTLNRTVDGRFRTIA